MRNILLEIKALTNFIGFFRTFFYVVKCCVIKIMYYNSFWIYCFTDKNVPSYNVTSLEGEVCIAEKIEDVVWRSVFGPLTLRTFQKRFALGDRCFFFLYEGKPIHYSWVSFAESRLLRLKRGDAYLYNAYTHPHFRGHNIHSSFVEKRINFAYEAGAANVYIGVAKCNHAAIGVLEKKFKLRKRGSVRLLRLLGKSIA